MILLGLDLETSGDSHERSAPIQVGLALEDGRTFSSYVGDWWFGGTQCYEWSEEAAGIHNIPQALVDGRWDWVSVYGEEAQGRTHPDPAPAEWRVDNAAVTWLGEIAPVTRPDNWKPGSGWPPPGWRTFVPVGWNVAGFDLPFIRKHFPQVDDRLKRYSIDLNAICFALAVPGKVSYKRIKSRAKDHAAEVLGESSWHDALFDARAALSSYQFLRDVIAAGGLSAYEQERR